MSFYQRILSKLRFGVWARLKANTYPSFNLSHSQFGEDMIVRALTQNNKTGFYVEIGAHHPVYLSNTYHFYCKGWRGINIDAKPGSMQLFDALRPRDINLEICIAPSEYSQVDYYLFQASAYNTCDPQTADDAVTQGQTLLNKIKLPTTTLTSVLEHYLPSNTPIDFMSVDVEGLDESILMSNNWAVYQPNILIFEKPSVSFCEIDNLPVVQYLYQFGYQTVAKIGPSLVLMKQELWQNDQSYDNQ